MHKNPVAVMCGHGKPSAKRIRDGPQSHMAEGSAIVGDKGKSHDSLARAVRGTHEACRADVGDPVYLERMSPTPGGGWKLLHDEYLEPTGLLPLGEAESLVSSRP